MNAATQTARTIAPNLLVSAAAVRGFGPRYDRSVDTSAQWVEEALSGAAGGLVHAVKELRDRLVHRGLSK